MRTERREELEQFAEDRGTDDASSFYPSRDQNDYRWLRLRGRYIAHCYGLRGQETRLFAQRYASSYQNEIAGLDRDKCYEYSGLTLADMQKNYPDWFSSGKEGHYGC